MAPEKLEHFPHTRTGASFLPAMLSGRSYSYCYFKKIFLSLFGCTRSWLSQVVLVLKSPPTNAGRHRRCGSLPGSGRSAGGENGNPLQYSCLEKAMDRGAWWATVLGATHSQTRLSNSARPHQLLVPTPGMEPGPPALGVWRLTHWTTGEVPITIVIIPIL